ncbi:MAG: hypothetical protein ACFFB2_11250 [Promethearchaeota archaeon]
MRSHEIAKIVQLINHPIRIKILQILFVEPLSYSDMLKRLKLESTGKFSFHLDKLSPLIHKAENGDYYLSEAGARIYSLLETLESEELTFSLSPLPDVDYAEGSKTIQEVWNEFLSHRNFLVIFYAVGVLVLVMAVFTYDFINFAKNNEILENLFVLMMTFLVFGVPFVFFVLYLLHHQKRFLPSNSFILGLPSFLILNLTTFFFLSECNLLFLNIVKPNWSYHKEQPSSPLELIVIAFKSFFFYEFPNYLTPNPYYYFTLFFFALYLIFWFFFYFIAAHLVIYFSKQKKWIKWNDNKVNEVIFLPKRVRFIEHKVLWFFLIIIYIFFLIGFDEPLVPPILHLLPVFPTLSISVLILRDFSLNSTFSRTRKLILLFLVVCPNLSLNFSIGICQTISLTGYAIILHKLVQYNKESTFN